VFNWALTFLSGWQWVARTNSFVRVVHAFLINQSTVEMQRLLPDYYLIGRMQLYCPALELQDGK